MIKKSDIEIAFFIFIAAIIFFVSEMVFTYVGISSKEIKYTIIEDDVICETRTVIEVDGYDKIYYPLRIRGNKTYDAQMYINGKKIDYSFEENRYHSSNTGSVYKIDLKQYPSFSKFGKNKIEFYVKYREYSGSIDRYNNMDLLYLPIEEEYCLINGEEIESFINREWKELDLSFIKNLNVSLNSDVPIKNAKVNIKNIDEEIETDYSYEFSIKKDISPLLKDSVLYLGLNFKEDDSEKYNIMDRECDFNSLYNEEFEEEQVNTEANINSIICLCLIISLIVLIFSIHKNLRIITTKECNEKYENLISPVLAEVLIDGKIDLKSLIMSSIIDLNIRGNIEIINNNTIQLLNLENTEQYEKEIINLIFNKKNIVEFKEINNIFKEKSNFDKLSKTLINIKKEIIKKLYSLNIFSEKNTYITKIINIIPILIIFNLILVLLLYKEFSDMGLGLSIFIFGSINMPIIGLFMKKVLIEQESNMKLFVINNSRSISNIKYNRNSLWIFILFLLALYNINVITYSSTTITLLTCVLIICLLTIFINRKYSLTSKGYKEKEKLLKIKNYINKYSLMKDRDLNSVIVWDKYLAYATAFRIPSQIINSIYEHWYSINMNLRFMNSIIEIIL